MTWYYDLDKARAAHEMFGGFLYEDFDSTGDTYEVTDEPPCHFKSFDNDAELMRYYFRLAEAGYDETKMEMSWNTAFTSILMQARRVFNAGKIRRDDLERIETLIDEMVNTRREQEQEKEVLIDDEEIFQDMKDAIIKDYSWRSQSGPNDSCGYERDVKTQVQIEQAESWEELASVAPMEWSTAVVNRCHRDAL